MHMTTPSSAQTKSHNSGDRTTRKKNVVLVQKLSAWNMPVLRMMSLAGFDVFYMFYPDHLKSDDASRESIEHPLEKKGFYKFSFADLGGSDTYGYAKHSPKFAKAIFDDLLGQVEFDQLTSLFEGLEQSAEKLPTLFFDQIVNEALEVGNLVSVADALRSRGHQVCVFHPASALQKRIFSKRLSGYTNLYPGAVASLFDVGCKLIPVAKRIVRKLIVHRRPQSTPSEGDDANTGLTPEKCPPVAFFPYKGVVYNNLFYKDHYYDPNPESPYHQKRILHVEMLDDRHDVAELSQQYYRDCGINLAFMEMGLGLNRENARLLINAARQIWGATSQVTKWREKTLAFVVMMRGYVQFLRGWKNSAPFADVKVALIGFDYLFATSFVLALQARGIKVVAMQDRYILTFHESFHPVFDTYFVSGVNVQKRLSKSPFHWLGEMPVIGLVRSERLKTYREEGAPVAFEKVETPQKLVVVLDFLSYPDPLTDADNSMVCWETNRAFYQDILRLAGEHPDAHFVIRGKNDAWCSIPYYADIMETIDATPNVEVNHEYEEVYVSYKMIAMADLVIGRATSLGDEALSVGTPVLFHDWTPMRASNVADICDYDGFPIYVHSYDDLSKRTEDILKHGHYVDEEQFAHIREENYCASNASPKQAMMDHLHAILD